MVTFFCNNCGEYLKKKQAEMHGYCNNILSCNDCKKDIKGFDAIKAHTSCNLGTPVAQNKQALPHNNGATSKPSGNTATPKAQTPVSNGVTQKLQEQVKPASQINGATHKKSQEIETENSDKIEWDGFRNTLRRVVKRQPNKEVGKLVLKKKLRLIFEKAHTDHDGEYDSLFEQKLQKTRNIQLLGDKVRYSLASN